LQESWKAFIEGRNTTLYLNTVPFADNVFGIQAAAERFYQYRLKNLTVDQAALLIGMLKSYS